MAKLNYKRLKYVNIGEVSEVVYRELEKQGIDKTNIRKIAWYQYGSYARQPLIVFLRDGRIFKVGVRRNNIYVEKIK
ncbi:MAG: hypothetical protein DRI61_05825 [Chloroflexi bacterium]|nr:MAG: hypothetical protein DRI61_05825 [Chloroflexota bacterium]